MRYRRSSVSISSAAAAVPAHPVAVIGVDLASGQLRTRVDRADAGRESTLLIGAGPAGAVLFHWTVGANEIIVVTPAGERRVITTLPDSAHVVPAGQWS